MANETVTGQTGSDGKCTLQVSKGVYKLSVTKEGYIPFNRIIEVEKSGEMDIQLVRTSNVNVTVNVKDPLGNVYDDRKVVLSVNSEELEPKYTDNNGQCVFTNIPKRSNVTAVVYDDETGNVPEDIAEVRGVIEDTEINLIVNNGDEYKAITINNTVKDEQTGDIVNDVYCHTTITGCTPEIDEYYESTQEGKKFIVKRIPNQSIRIESKVFTSEYYDEAEKVSVIPAGYKEDTYDMVVNIHKKKPLMEVTVLAEGAMTPLANFPIIVNDGSEFPETHTDSQGKAYFEVPFNGEIYYFAGSITIDDQTTYVINSQFTPTEDDYAVTLIAHKQDGRTVWDEIVRIVDDNTYEPIKDVKVDVFDDEVHPDTSRITVYTDNGGLATIPSCEQNKFIPITLKAEGYNDKRDDTTLHVPTHKINTITLHKDMNHVTGKVTVENTTTSIANAKITFENTQTGKSIDAITDNNGDFETYVPDGTYIVIPTHDDYTARPEVIEITKDVNLEITMFNQDEGWLVWGRVVEEQEDGTYKPSADKYVKVSTTEGMKMVSTDSAGIFKVAEKYDPSIASLTLEVVGDNTYSLYRENITPKKAPYIIQRKFKRRSVIFDVCTKELQHIGGAVVNVADSEGNNVFSGISEGSGLCETTPLRSSGSTPLQGRIYNVSVVKGGYAPSNYQIWVYGDDAQPLPKRLYMYTLDDVGRYIVQVQDKDSGKPVEDYRIRARLKDGQSSDDATYYPDKITDSEGKTTIYSFPKTGTVIFSGSGSGYSQLYEEIDLSTISGTVITLKVSTVKYNQTYTVKDEDGNLMEDVTVSLERQT